MLIKRSKMIICCMICFMGFYFAFLDNSVLTAAEVENKRWSFDFKNYAISEALEKMTKVTGIDIFTNKNRDKSLFNKSYKDQTIDQILKDLFRKENSAMVWSYGDNGLESIGVWIFEGSGSGGSFSPNRFTKQRGRNLMSNRIKKDVDHKPRVVRRQYQGAEKDDLFSLQGESRDYTNDVKESIGSQYSKISTGGSQSKSANLGHTISGGDESEPTLAPLSPMPEVARDEDQEPGTIPPPPAPEKWHGLEPPPMPAGFPFRN